MEKDIQAEKKMGKDRKNKLGGLHSEPFSPDNHTNVLP